MFSLFKKDEKEYNYFKVFQAISMQIVAVADLLATNLQLDSFDSLDKVLGEIQRIENLGNEQKKELLNYLYDDFLPPIERQDIIALTHSLNQILKNTADLLYHRDMYQIETIQPTMHDLALQLEKSVDQIPEMMLNLEDFKQPQKIRETLREMDTISMDAIQLYRKGVKKLSLGEMNSFDTMKYTRMYESFDEFFRSIKNLMEIVEAVIIQNT